MSRNTEFLNGPMNSLLAHVRRAFGRSAEGTVAYRITLERETDADRATYVKQVESITEGLEVSIRDAGANVFDSVYVSRTGGPYSQTMVEIEEKKEQLMELDAWLDPVERFGPPLLSRKSVGDVRGKREKIDRQLDKLLHIACCSLRN